ncbi:hypothetical protein PHYSODRAFT_525536 [Phytophthora sojae]|uniref:Uncharacterized protein n=1 Tax=Phytophthora sojae (strain P6497) TaxID=1094619 RepID=G5A625_PHYSP|nr:hypothetical protein PHYSODRAFT_525536 [Phytophthora sojae]EGZ08780.1 hypothetical protein PHYSODRAFT_525536 [Phytophthora sojae]|eukprot:XP_009535413.1 hypothetical protein PHYSODRAFT_525536 [Phytophthora sojae]
MVINAGDTVLVLHGSLLLDAEVKEIEYLSQPDRPEEWVARDRFCGPKRLDAMAAWMNTVDDALVRLDKDVKDLIQHQANQAAHLLELERRKKEALEEKAELEAAVLTELKRVRVAEETALARKRLQDAGVDQEEIDAILPVIPHTA